SPLPRDPARRHLGAVVEGRRRDGARGGGAERPAAGPDAAGAAAVGRFRDAGRAGRARVVAAIPKEKPSRIDELRAEFARYKADVKSRGKPFYPYAMFHDTIMSLVVVCPLIGLAA